MVKIHFNRYYFVILKFIYLTCVGSRNNRCLRKEAIFIKNTRYFEVIIWCQILIKHFRKMYRAFYHKFTISVSFHKNLPFLLKKR